MLLVCFSFGSLTLTGCPVDRRELEGEAGAGGKVPLGSSGEAGESSAGQAGETGFSGSGGDGEGGTAGVAGSSARGGTSQDGGGGGSPASAGSANACACGGTGGNLTAETCPDLDGNGVPDCDETLVQNFAFDANTQHWGEETGLVISWSPVDAADGESSGSLLVENQTQADRDGSSMAGGRQCIPVVGGKIYQVGAQVWIPEGQGDGTGGVQILFHGDEACTGTLVDSVTSNLVSAGANWKTVVLSQRAPTTSRSVRIRLIVVKTFRDDPLKVHFDNVLTRAE